MTASTVTGAPGNAAARRFDLRVVAAFFAIYILWGTTFLAIRIAVAEIPPLLAAGLRFFTAGVLLFGFMRLRGQPSPTRTQWRNLALIGALMFVAEYGPLFWAEKFISSGITSVLAATIPILTIVVEMLVFRLQPLRWSLVSAALLGFCGVGILLLPGGSVHVPAIPALAVLAGSTTWALGSVLNRSLDLPGSRPLTAGASMMLGGGALLLLSPVFGELHPFPHLTLRAVGALAYLVVVGSLLAFTAFIWLLARMPATSVSSYAYVNPVVAVALGFVVLHEQITARMLVGAAIVVVSVFLTLRASRKKAEPAK